MSRSQTPADYEKDLEANLNDLLGRMKSGRYFAPPVRRHYIPKADGTKRPLGIPTFEDKVAQRTILMLLEPIYETDFLPPVRRLPGVRHLSGCHVATWSRCRPRSRTIAGSCSSR